MKRGNSRGVKTKLCAATTMNLSSNSARHRSLHGWSISSSGFSMTESDLLTSFPNNPDLLRLLFLTRIQNLHSQQITIAGGVRVTGIPTNIHTLKQKYQALMLSSF